VTLSNLDSGRTDYDQDSILKFDFEAKIDTLAKAEKKMWGLV
jgi:hypothetical protein